mmetsp:Transcript_20629/g.65977  ORF Transcript_20629/g.65977 Transcript_20629/m.65977 type:complete len:245 (+) Transcript_20629:593-1327(+)
MRVAARPLMRTAASGGVASFSTTSNARSASLPSAVSWRRLRPPCAESTKHRSSFDSSRETPPPAMKVDAATLRASNASRVRSRVAVRPERSPWSNASAALRILRASPPSSSASTVRPSRSPASVAAALADLVCRCARPSKTSSTGLGTGSMSLCFRPRPRCAAICRQLHSRPACSSVQWTNALSSSERPAALVHLASLASRVATALDAKPPPRRVATLSKKRSSPSACTPSITTAQTANPLQFL